jgi:hypothetical protein
LGTDIITHQGLDLESRVVGEAHWHCSWSDTPVSRETISWCIVVVERPVPSCPISRPSYSIELHGMCYVMHEQYQRLV